MKQFIAFCMSLIILITPFSVFSQDYDLSRGEAADMLLAAADFYNPGIQKNDILKGYDDGQLHEERGVSRAEALVMLSRAFGKLPETSGHNKNVALKKEDFSDIPLWAQAELENVFDSGIVAGTAKGVFSPDDNVTKDQMKLFIKRVYALYGENLKDDFYASVNKEILENIEILPGNLAAGTLESMQIQAAEQLEKIINKVVSGKNPMGTPEQKLADLYKCVIDVEKRNREGVSPIKEYIDKINDVKNIAELTMMHDVLSSELCINAFIGFNLTVDFEDSDKYVLCFDSMRPFMNREFYFEEGKKKESYIKYLQTVLALGGETKEKSLSDSIKYFEFEKNIAENMLSAEEENDIKKVYNVNSYNKLCVMFPDFDLGNVLSDAGLAQSDRIIVTDKARVKKFSELYNQSNLDVLKIAMKLAVLSECGAALSEDFTRAKYELDKVILGKKGAHDIRQQAIFVLQSTMPEYLGSLYAEKTFDKASQKDVRKITNDIIDVFKRRIEDICWMSENAKAKAKTKLDSIEVKIGAPDISETYLDNVSIIPPENGGTYFSNMLAVKKEAIQYYGAMQFNEVNHNMWIMEPYTVNAAYNVSANDITLPAAVLQAPLYDINASYEEKLGGIGYIIAHEITHAFDSNGAKFDENGNIGTWWSEEDYISYESLCEKVVDFFDGEEIIPAVRNNGRLTLNENIADIGAVACITQLAKEKNGVDLKKLYIAVANTWVNTSSREYMAFAAQSDVHSNGKLRVNRVLVNFPEFYEAFDIGSDDGMYVPPEERILIW